MALLFTSWWTELFFTVSFLLFLYYLYFKLHASKYWKRKNIFHLPPVFFFGNVWRGSITENFAILVSDMHRKYKEHKMVGFWVFTTPSLIVTDIEIIKNILTRDFNHFRDRGIPVDTKHDPLAGNLFNVSGAKWRNLRVRLTPTFTSGKMKMMFPTVVETGEELQRCLQKVGTSKEGVEVKEILARFTTDIISSCAFGIQTNSLKNPDSEFRTYGRKIFDPSIHNVVVGILFNIAPTLIKFLRLSFTPKDVTNFFMNAVRDTMDYREKNTVRRNDFMQLLIELKNKGRIEDVDGVIPTTQKEDASPSEDLKFTFNDAAAQAFVFFAAGFETSSTALTFALYELALNPDIQDTLHREIDAVLQKDANKLMYESVMQMEYLDWVVQETLRKYPPVTFLMRSCNKDYEIPEMNVTIPKDLGLMISVFAIQRDPEFFPDPEKFDPKRYSPEEKAKRHHFSNLFFGEGPRNCIGNRFGLMQTKVGLVSILSKFNVYKTKDTPFPLKFHKVSFVLTSESGMPLRFVERT